MSNNSAQAQQNNQPYQSCAICGSIHHTTLNCTLAQQQSALQQYQSGAMPPCQLCGNHSTNYTCAQYQQQYAAGFSNYQNAPMNNQSIPQWVQQGSLNGLINSIAGVPQFQWLEDWYLDLIEMKQAEHADDESFEVWHKLYFGKSYYK